jgi:hypothetical protein
MRKLTTNRFLAKTLRILCCLGALTACSAWATVATWQLNSSLDETFVSVPSVQFASMPIGSTSILPVTVAAGPDPVPVPEMSSLFPIVGLIVAVSCTQILRRRRAAQLSAARIVG